MSEEVQTIKNVYQKYKFGKIERNRNEEKAESTACTLLLPLGEEVADLHTM